MFSCSPRLPVPILGAKAGWRKYDSGTKCNRLLGFLALEGVLLWSVFNGMGKHMADLTTEELIISFKTIPAAYVTVSTLNTLTLF